MFVGFGRAAARPYRVIRRLGVRRFLGSGEAGGEAFPEVHRMLKVECLVLSEEKAASQPSQSKTQA
jgi:hypothetical protein